MCSWCYAFNKTFDEIKMNLAKNIKIIYVPGGLANNPSEIMSEEMKKEIESIWYQIEKIVDVKFNHDFWNNCTPRRATYLACQATLAAKVQGKEEKMIKAIQNAYYQRAINPSELSTLIDLAQELNLDVQLFTNTITSEENIKHFTEKLNLRKKLNLNSFPSLAIRYKKEIYPINIKYNEPQKMLEQIKDITNNIYF
jgi:putative protein-disulfide isomerase